MRRAQLAAARRQAAAGGERHVDAPLAHEGRDVEAGRGFARRVAQVFGDVEANAARADDRHRFAHRPPVQQHVDIRHDLRMVEAGNRRRSRHHAGGQHNLVKAPGDEPIGLDANPEPQLDARQLDAPPEVPQRFIELFLARDAPRHVELAADVGRRLEQHDLVPPFSGQRGASEPRRTCADHRHPAWRGRRPELKLGLVAGARVDQAGGYLLLEHMVEAGLVAADAGVDLVRAPRRRLDHEIRVGEQGPRHGHHVRVAATDDRVGYARVVDAVAGDQRHRHRATQPARDPGEGAARHHGGDGRDPRLVPADTGVDDGRTRRLDRNGQLDDLLPGAAALDQVQHRQPVDEDEVGSGGLAHAPHDLDREPHAVGEAAAPVVAAPVGARRDELVDEVAFRAHHLDAVVAGLAGQRSAAGEGRDLPVDAKAGQAARRERRDRRLDARRRHRQWMVGIAAGVQDLHADPAARLMHGRGDLAVARCLTMIGELAGEGLGPAGDVRRDAAGHDQAHPAAGALSEVLGEPGKVAGAILEAGVHRAHEDAVAQRHEAEVEGLEQMRIGLGRHGRNDTSRPGSLGCSGATLHR